MAVGRIEFQTNLHRAVLLKGGLQRIWFWNVRARNARQVGHLEISDELLLRYCHSCVVESVNFLKQDRQSFQYVENRDSLDNSDF